MLKVEFFNAGSSEFHVRLRGDWVDRAGSIDHFKELPKWHAFFELAYLACDEAKPKKSIDTCLRIIATSADYPPARPNNAKVKFRAHSTDDDCIVAEISNVAGVDLIMKLFEMVPPWVGLLVLSSSLDNGAAGDAVMALAEEAGRCS